MALIECPNCGKMISDTTNKCIHCEYDLVKNSAEQTNENITELKDFDDCFPREKLMLRNEFYKTSGVYAIHIKKYKRYEMFLGTVGIALFGSIILLVIAFVIRLIKLIAYNDDSGALAYFIFTTLFSLILVVSLTVVFCAPRFGRKYEHNHLIIEKKFQHWLKCEKNINYVVKFTDKEKEEKAFFDAIDVDNTQLEE